MAVSSGYGYGVRQGLAGKGIENQDIGYNPASGYVTVKGQNFIKPQKLYQGTSFTTQPEFNTAWEAYNKSQQQPMQMTGQPVLKDTTGVSALGTAAQGALPVAGTTDTTQTAPYTPPTTETQLNDLIQMLMKQAQTPTPVDINAIYGSPQWAAAQAQSQRGAQQGIRAAQEALGSAGFGRSTALGERAQGIQNQATEYLQTQVLPQLMAAAQQERQQQLQNQIAMLDPLMKQQQFAETTAQQRGALTGSFLPPEARSAIDRITQLGEAWKTGTPEQRTQYHQEAERLRSTLTGMGVDPSLFGAGVSTEGRLANVGRAGVQTQAALEAEQSAAYKEARDKILDERAKEKFDFDVEQKGLEFAADEAYRRGQLSREDARIAISRAAEERLKKQAEEKEVEEKPTKIDAKTSADNYDLLYDDLQTQGITKEQARQLIEANRDFLTDSDYKNLKNWANDNL